MRDVPGFIEKAREIYGYQHFLNDAGGSVCELDDPETLAILAEHTLILYIKTTPELEQTLIERAASDPKPLYYREAFLDEQLAAFMREKAYANVDDIPPDEFVTWVFPKLFRSRLPRYQAIADEYGYTVDARDIAGVEGEDDFIQLMARALSAA
jgi:hypothetical protein